MEYLFAATCIASAVLFCIVTMCSTVYDTRRMHRHHHTGDSQRFTINTIADLVHLLNAGLAISFVKSARLLGIRPAMTRQQRQRKRLITRLLTIYRLLLCVAIGYAVFTAAMYGSIEPLLIIAVGFLAYFTVSILILSQLTIWQRAYTLLLAPVALWYYLFLLYGTVLERFANMAKAVFPISVGLFVRIKNIFRVV